MGEVCMHVSNAWYNQGTGFVLLHHVLLLTKLKIIVLPPLMEFDST